MEHAIRDLFWVGSSREDLASYPDEVQDVMGYALYLAQVGGKHPAAKPLQGFNGAGVPEVVDDHDGDTYRAVHTVLFPEGIYVPTLFSRSRSGTGSPPPARCTADRRTAQACAAEPGSENVAMDENIAITRGSGNVYADLGQPNADEALNRARLAHRIAVIVEERGWSQSRAAREMGIDQPKLSAIMRGNLRDFSLLRLAGYLNRLDQDVEIRTRPNPDRSRPARTFVFTDDQATVAGSDAHVATIG